MSSYFLKTKSSILDNDNLREPQKDAYYNVYNHFIKKGKETSHALLVIPTGERVIIVTGCINALRSRVSETLVNMIHALLRVIRL